MASRFEMRAAPRRCAKVEGAGGADDQPVFLRKAFAMVTNCPADIGGWSPNGDTVLVKDVDRFASEVIPTSFKHNNFSSFVRQLNFYGFRKIKSELSEKELWWEFRHPRFQKGKQEWLSEIKRSVHIENTSTQEVYDLKNEVSTLHDRVASLTGKIAQLTNFVENLVANPQQVFPTGVPSASQFVEASSKKRRYEGPDAASVMVSDDASSFLTGEDDATSLDNIAEDFNWEDLEGLFEADGEQLREQPAQALQGSIPTAPAEFPGAGAESRLHCQPPVAYNNNNNTNYSASLSPLHAGPPVPASPGNAANNAHFMETLGKLFTPEAMATLTEKFNEFSCIPPPSVATAASAASVEESDADRKSVV